MGGGDLNSKKSWHPNTMKNQERVWKAEQAAADEKKRIIELQREREVEKDRSELNNMIKKNTGTTDDNRLHWMYDKPDKKVKEEDFLLGKAIDKDIDHSNKPESDAIPALSRRVVGSSMLTSGGDSQVDIARKIREDPLLLIKERERAARAALLNNPLQRKRLTELLRKEQLQKKDTKNEKKHKKKDKDLDNILAAKLNALGGDKGIDLGTLLDSDGSSSDSSTKEKSKKKKKKRKKEKSKKKSKKAEKKRKHTSSNDSEESNETDRPKKNFYKNKETLRERKCSPSAENRKRKSDDYHKTDYHNKSKKYKRDSTPPEKQPDHGNTSEWRQQRHSSAQYNSKRQKRGGLTDEEISLRLAAMASAGAEREKDRTRRVADQRAADEAAEARPTRHLVRSQARVLPDSVESRIHSNRHFIQRNSQHMSEHFARR